MEKTALMTINNPHILKGIRIVQDELNCYLITELCNGGTLKDFIKANGPLGD
jgi:serine/threonine protein kinase